MDGGSQVYRVVDNISKNPWIFLKDYLEYFEKMNKRLLETISCVLEEKGEDSLHDMRTSCRRLQACINLLLYFSDYTQPKETIKDLKRILKKSNKARDYQVYLDYLKGLKNSDQKFIDYFEKKFYKQKDKIKNYLSSLNTSKLETELEQTVSILTTELIKNFEPKTHYFTESYFEEFKAIYDTFQKSDKQNDEQLHKLRIKVKNLRYKMEILGEFDEEKLKEEKSLKLIQDILGKHHDLVILKKRLIKKFQNKKLSFILEEINDKIFKIENEIKVDVQNILNELYSTFNENNQI
jgi:CHAD domain-containing protein